MQLGDFKKVTHAVINYRINVIFEWYFFRTKVFLVRGRGVETLKKSKKTGRRKTSNNEEKKSRIIK